jgi:hypothetical protein
LIDFYEVVVFILIGSCPPSILFEKSLVLALRFALLEVLFARGFVSCTEDCDCRWTYLVDFPVREFSHALVFLPGFPRSAARPIFSPSRFLCELKQSSVSL